MHRISDFPISYRIQRTTNAADLPKGTVERYSVVADQSDHCFEFLFSKRSMMGRTEVTSHSGSNGSLEGKTGLGGMSWVFMDNKAQAGYLKAPNLASTGWKAQIRSGAELAMLDATKLKDQLLRNALNGWPDAYHLMKGGEIIGYISREPRNPEPPKGLFGKVRRLFADFDWVLRLRAGLADDDLLSACCLALGTIVITVPSDRS
ncbi:hypothetical protein E1180_02935 [Roseibium denhamense]|uniref:Uncharacterized protein n=1 Tax=Roseibium denhamense TaxID=76305 RepID=A0ABY1P8N2_9HYPH|nr:hypothetical protein [Roseibium denhamense]MTI04472.1 hypothetical protein [Roseibium denhamense]SMP28576.1 hypothetical protein SAMN06265374_2948 [Roseibium denhamense]